MKIQYRIWDNLENKYFQPTYQAWAGNLLDLTIDMEGRFLMRTLEQPAIDESTFPDRFVAELYADRKDKNGVDVFDGDIIRIRQSYRTTQTHTGDNIPNGSYTEPMEPGIREIVGVVTFKDSCFFISCDDGCERVLHYHDQQYTEDDIQVCIGSYGGIWDEPDEGDMQYLFEISGTNSLEELIQHLSGIEIIGNIHENPDLLK